MKRILRTNLAKQDPEHDPGVVAAAPGMPVLAKALDEGAVVYAVQKGGEESIAAFWRLRGLNRRNVLYRMNRLHLEMSLPCGDHRELRTHLWTGAAVT